MEKITIDKTIEIFEGIKKGICPWYPELYYDKAINTMRKYQKIKDIYERFQKDGNYYHHMAWLDVMEVIEDGNEH